MGLVREIRKQGDCIYEVTSGMLQLRSKTKLIRRTIWVVDYVLKLQEKEETVIMDFEPPFQENYKTLLQNKSDKLDDENGDRQPPPQPMFIEQCELPLIDLSHLQTRGSSVVRAKCRRNIVEAARKWGFFQLVNHGFPTEILESMKHEQTKLFRLPFQKKAELSFLNLSSSSSSPTKSYRWGNPRATCLKQLSWSEAFHIPFASISRMKGNDNFRYGISVLDTH